jgi:hypothetical protein
MASERAKKQPKPSREPAKARPRGGRVIVADQGVFARSRLTSGKDLLPYVDGRSHWARIMRDTLNAIVAHCGGVDVISETLRMMARRAACLETELIYLESKFARIRAEGGEPVLAEVEVYGRLAGNQRRIAEALGWERTARDVTPTLTQYMRMSPAERAGIKEETS